MEPTESTFSSVVGAEDHAAAFVEAYDGGAIAVSGVGTVRAVEVETVEIGVKIVRVVDGLFG